MLSRAAFNFVCYFFGIIVARAQCSYAAIIWSVPPEQKSKHSNYNYLLSTDFCANANSCTFLTHNLTHLYGYQKFNWNLSCFGVVWNVRVSTDSKFQANDYEVDVVIVTFRIISWKCCLCKSVSSIQFFIRALEGMSVEHIFFSSSSSWFVVSQCSMRQKCLQTRRLRIDLEFNLLEWVCRVVRMYRLSNDLKHWSSFKL